MDNGKVASRYAKALLNYALDKGQEDRLYAEMELLADNFISQPALQEVIANPTISAGDKKKIITTAGGIHTSEVFQSFVELLSNNKRETYCHVIALKYRDFYRKYKKLLIGALTSAKEINAESKDKLKEIIKSVTGCEVDFKTNTDPSLIGGFILDIDYVRLDASISNQLNTIKEAITEKNRNIVN